MSSEDDPDFSPLVNLNSDVELAILKQLELRDYVNLASICRKWYNRAVTAPRSTKALVKVEDLIMWYDGFETTIKDKPTPIPRNFETNIRLLYKIKCKTLIVKHGFMQKSRKRRNGSLEHSVDYLNENRDIIKMDEICYEPRRDMCTKADLLIKLFKLTKEMRVGFTARSMRVLPKQKKEIAVAIEQSVHVEKISCVVDISVEVIRRIIEAVTMGNRPNLKIFRCAAQRLFSTHEPIRDYLLENLEDRTSSTESLCLYYSDSHNARLWINDLSTFIFFEIVPKRVLFELDD